MKIKYLRDTDTLYIDLQKGPIREMRDLDADILADVGADGTICALTIEHARKRAGMPAILFEEIESSVQGGRRAIDALIEWGEQTGAFRGVDADEYVRQLREGWDELDGDSALR